MELFGNYTEIDLQMSNSITLYDVHLIILEKDASRYNHEENH